MTIREQDFVYEVNGAYSRMLEAARKAEDAGERQRDLSTAWGLTTAVDILSLTCCDTAFSEGADEWVREKRLELRTMLDRLTA